MIKRKKYFVYVLVFALLTIVTDCCYMFVNSSPYITKTIASVCFVVFGVINFILVVKKSEYQKYKIFNLLMVLGLIFACLGDIFLIGDFVLGAIFFAIGHIFYLIAFICLSKYRLLDLLISMSIFVIAMLVILLYPKFEFGNMLPMILGYAFVISFMLGKAFGNLISKTSLKTIIIAVGAFLFFFSDLMLLFNVFALHAKLFSILCLATYYPAEYLLGLSILINNKKQ